MKSDLLQGIIFVKGSTPVMQASTTGYRKITVVSKDNYQPGNGRISSANFLRKLNKLRSFS